MNVSEGMWEQWANKGVRNRDISTAIGRNILFTSTLLLTLSLDSTHKEKGHQAGGLRIQHAYQTATPCNPEGPASVSSRCSIYRPSSRLAPSETAPIYFSWRQDAATNRHQLRHQMNHHASAPSFIIPASAVKRR